MTRILLLLLASVFLVAAISARPPSITLADEFNGKLLDEPAIRARAETITSATREVYRSWSSRQRAPSAFLRIGQLKQTHGSASQYSALQMNAWDLWLARNPVLFVNGVELGIELIVYIDGSEVGEGANTTAVLTEWLVKEDRVHILSTGVQGNGLAMIQTAEALGTPCINSGLYDASFLPPFNWSLYLLPKLQNLGVACTSALLAAGAKTFVIFDDPTGFLHLLYEPVITALGGNITARFNITPQMHADPALYDPLIEQIKDLNPDVIAGSATEGEDAEELEGARIQRMHRLGLNPKSILSWSVGSYPRLRANLTWQAAGLLIAEAYQPSLNQPDPVWGNSRQYDADYRARFGIPTTNNDAALAGSITLIVVALNNSNVNLSDPSDIMSSLSSVNTSSIFGPINFVDNFVQRLTYCFQNTFPNASDVSTVWPPSSSAYVEMTYPAYVNFPDNFFDQFKKSKDRTVAIVLGSVFGALGFLLLLGLVVMLILWKKYHVIFISKGKQTAGGDWA